MYDKMKRPFATEPWDDGQHTRDTDEEIGRFEDEKDMKTGYSLYRTFDAETDREYKHLRCAGVRGDIRYVYDCAVAYLKYAEPGTYRLAEIYTSEGKERPAITGKSGTPQFCRAPAR